MSNRPRPPGQPGDCAADFPLGDQRPIGAPSSTGPQSDFSQSDLSQSDFLQSDLSQLEVPQSDLSQLEVPQLGALQSETMSAPEPMDHLPLTDTVVSSPAVGSDAALAIDFARFELLSAYLDGEVTPEERSQVEGWLAQDPAVQKLYASMTGVQMRTKSMPVPQAVLPEETLVAVMQRLDRRRRRFWLVSGSAIAATVTAAITAMTGGFSGPMLQLANQTSGDRHPLSIASSLQKSPAVASPQASPDDEDQPMPSVVERALIVE